jgi:putative tryptophan/tyrosine transport system substrate-binding protein
VTLVRPALLACAGADAMFPAMLTKIVALAARGGLPAFYNLREFVDAGGLMSFGSSIRAAHARAAVFADRILRNANRWDMPVEQPAKFAPATLMAHATGTNA